MRKIWIVLIICCVTAACKKNDVSFKYSPEAPRAGQSVQFTNLSTSGEEWSWSFGDGVTSTLKSPSHTYKAAGKYVVTLKVDNKKQWTVAQEVTVVDTFPTFVASDSVFYIYQDYTFTPNVYNPYNYEVSYEWTCSDSLYADGTTLKGYFTDPEDSTEITLKITINDVITYVVKHFYIQDKKTNSVCLRTADGDYRQRIYGKRAEAAKADASAAARLDAEQDTMQTYNGYTFYLSELRTVVEEMVGFHIANRKLYFRGNGLWVANIDGSYPVQIDELECSAMTLDMTDNRIYWANQNGVWYMPFVGSDNNQFVSVPTQLNDMKNVSKLAADSTLR